MNILPVKNLKAAFKATGPTHNQLALQWSLSHCESETHTLFHTYGPRLNVQ